MPTYEYKCSACGHAFEQFQSMSAEPVKRCPKCKKLKVKRLLGTGAGLIFKGSGFYITDYRSDAYKSDQKGDSGTATESKSESTSGGGDDKSSKPSETKTETKAAEKSEPKPAPAPKKDPPAKPSAPKKK